MAAPATSIATLTRAADAATPDSTPARRSSDTPPPRALTGSPAVRLAEETRGGGALPPDMTRLVGAPGVGQPLPTSTRTALEASFRVSLAPVRVHADGGTRQAVDALSARALTYGRDVFLGSRERTSDLALMGHEVAHVVQQQASPVPQRAGCHSGGDGLEQEARAAGQAAARGEAVAVQGRTAGAQPQGLLEAVAEWAEEKAWALLNKYAPELVPIIREGPLAWIAARVGEAIEAVFDTVMAPVRAVQGVVAGLSEHFTNLLTWMREAAERIARGDCSAVTEAAERIQKVIEGLAERVFARLQLFLDKAKEVFNTFKERFAAPAWEFITRFAGRAWDRIKELATWIWDKTARIRSILERAWTWIKDKLGIGEGPEGQDGILQWIQRKAEAIWEERIKPFIERFKKPLLVVAGILVMFSPAGPILAVVGGAVGLVKGIQWIRQRLATKDGVVEGRGDLQNSIIPGIINGIRGFTAKLTGAVAGIVEKLNGVMAGFGDLVAAVGGSILRFAVGLVQWLADQFKGLLTWAADKLTKLAEWFGNALNRLIVFLQPVLDVLRQIAGVVGDILKLPALVVGELWKRIPACIRDPFVNFLINQVLKRIPIFKQLVEVLPAIWARLKATVMTVIRKIFREGDLAGAALAVFQLVLDALQIPLELVTAIFDKARAAIDLILKDPVGFLINILRTIKQGFQQFGTNALKHLAAGFRDWLFGAVAQAGISMPQDFSIKAIFGFVLEILGVTADRILERLEGKLGKEKMAPVRKALNTLAKAWDWVSTLLNEGPQGVWNRIKEKAGDLWTALRDGAIGWLIETITRRALAQLATMLEPTGIMAVVRSLIAVYKAIQSFVRYLKQILGIVHTMLDTVSDIAKGAIGTAADLLESAIARAIPIILGFLANQVGLGDLGERIREIVGVIQAKIAAAIDWVIEKAITAGGALLQFGKGIAAGVVTWWKKRMTIRGGAEPHELFFEGTEEAAELYIASRRTVLQTFLANIKPLPLYTDELRQKAIAAAVAQTDRIKEARTKMRADPTKRPTFEQAISNAFDEIGKHLGTVLHTDDYGTRENPIPLHWPGPPSADYPKLYLGGPIGTPVPQAGRIGLYNAKSLDETGMPVLLYTPHGDHAQALGIAIKPEFAIFKGQIVGPLSRDTTEGGGELEPILERYGYDPTAEGTQIDHLHEIQFGGLAHNDVIGNLWPLERRRNARKGAALGGGSVEYPKGAKIQVRVLKRVESPETTGDPPKKFYFRIDSLEPGT